MPERLQRQRKAGWRKPANSVYVGRPGKWGNPYTVGSRHKFRDVDGGEEFEGTIVDDKGAVSFFRKYAVERSQREPDWLKPLVGKNLLCWCKPGALCHADVLIELANPD